MMADDLRARAEELSRLIGAADRLGEVLGGSDRPTVKETKQGRGKDAVDGYALTVPIAEGWTVTTFIPSGVVDCVADHINAVAMSPVDRLGVATGAADDRLPDVEAAE